MTDSNQNDDCSVMVIDDDDDIRDSIVEILSEEGYVAVGASDGADALAQLRQGSKPCLILLDLMMPGMDGAAFRNVQLKDPALAQIPVVVISADRDTARSGDALNVAGVLKKPANLADLLEMVKRFCGDPPPSSKASM